MRLLINLSHRELHGAKLHQLNIHSTLPLPHFFKQTINNSLIYPKKLSVQNILLTLWRKKTTD